MEIWSISPIPNEVEKGQPHKGKTSQLSYQIALFAYCHTGGGEWLAPPRDDHQSNNDNCRNCCICISDVGKTVEFWWEKNFVPQREVEYGHDLKSGGTKHLILPSWSGQYRWIILIRLTRYKQIAVTGFNLSPLNKFSEFCSSLLLATKNNW